MKEAVVARAEKSHALYEGLVSALKQGTIAWLLAGEFLAKLKKGNAYKDVMGDPPAGHQWSWADFCSQGEIAIPVSTADKLCALYQTFKERLKLPDGAIQRVRFYRLKMLEPHITEANKQELLSAAEHLDRAGFEEVLVKATRGIEQETCAHDWKRNIFEQCTKCDKRRVKRI